MNDQMALLEAAWGLIANASEGNWEKTPEWHVAALRWRNRYHKLLAELRASGNLLWRKGRMADYLSALKAAQEKATPGPWEVVVEDGDEWWFGDGYQTEARPVGAEWGAMFVTGNGSEKEANPDVALAVLLRNATPELIALIEAAKEVALATPAGDLATGEDKWTAGYAGGLLAAKHLIAPALAALDAKVPTKNEGATT